MYLSCIGLVLSLLVSSCMSPHHSIGVLYGKCFFKTVSYSRTQLVTRSPQSCLGTARNCERQDQRRVVKRKQFDLRQLVAQLDDICIVLWVSVLIIQLAVASPYKGLQIASATAESRNELFWSGFSQNVFFMGMMEPQNNFGPTFLGFTPQNRLFCPTP